MKKSKFKITWIIEKTATGFSGYVVDCPIFTSGKNISELMDKALEASQLYFEHDELQLSTQQLKFEIDFKQFFQYYKVLNAKFLANKIGMNPALLSQYIQGHKRPSEKQTEKILLGIHQIGTELSEINLFYK